MPDPAGAPHPNAPRFTVVAPMLNEADAVMPMAEEIAEACAGLGPFEAIFVNDGSTDDTAERIAEARRSHPWLRELRHARPCGQSAAVRSGVLAAQGPYIVTIDGDNQNPPGEIPKLVRPFLEGARAGERPLGLVAGQRVGRKDTASKRLASRLANGLRARILGDDTRDTGCGLKAFPRAVFLALPFFDHLHRYLPALVKREGYSVMLVDVSHRARETGSSKYTNFGRAFVGVQDLLGVWWLIRRRKLAEVVALDPGMAAPVETPATAPVAASAAGMPEQAG
ncbi:glycosyltransferase family 2 protein [Paralimibaculum aggregatum]|uniref:Glycosyltransferase family 2 protein n=1 Tax=Paralimibaculum aggregatum TaxID=3036245 RepID=A0ABQ6LLG0_9RHOB|nr:glycosyltransferase family 2 protein [Limibaculum sp. NKW23]GMG81130.1 glycosyltransferase family 2 protein [Limibaculum sp. NKW23]